LILTFEGVFVVLNDLIGQVKQSRSILLPTSFALPIWSTLYLFLQDNRVLTMCLVTTWMLWRLVHEVGQVPLLGLFRLGQIFLESHCCSQPLNHQERQANNIHELYLNMAHKHKILHRCKRWTTVFWMHLSLAQRLKIQLISSGEFFSSFFSGIQGVSI